MLRAEIMEKINEPIAGILCHVSLFHRICSTVTGVFMLSQSEIDALLAGALEIEQNDGDVQR